MVLNFEKYISITKKSFYVSTLTLILTIVLSNFIEGTFFNAIYLLSFGITALIVAIAVSLFVFYWIGWAYRRIVIYRSERKEQRISE